MPLEGASALLTAGTCTVLPQDLTFRYHAGS